MAQRTQVPAGRRGKAAPVKRPFPWAVVAGWTALAVLLAAVLVYAASHQGSGFATALKKADSSMGSGLQVTDNLSRNHKTGPLHYSSSPPVGGDHNPQWESCQVYAQPIPNEHAVHSMEHGATWVTYRPDLPASDVQILAGLVSSNPYRLMSPYPGLRTLVSVQAWGRQMFFNSATDPRIAKFLDTYTQGPQTQEPGATCRGGVTVTGSTP